MGGFTHLEETNTKQMAIDPRAAERIHGKPMPRVHIETYGCQMAPKRTTSPFLGLIRKGLVYLRQGGPLDKFGPLSLSGTARNEPIALA